MRGGGCGAGGGGGEMAAIGVAPATDGGGPFERGRGGWAHHRVGCTWPGGVVLSSSGPFPVLCCSQKPGRSLK